MIRLGRRGGSQELYSSPSQLQSMFRIERCVHVPKQVRAQVRRDGGAEAASAVRKTPLADAAGVVSSSIRCTRPATRSRRLRARAGVETALEPSVGSPSASVLLRPISPRSRLRSALCRESRPAAHSVSSPRARAASETNNRSPSNELVFVSFASTRRPFRCRRKFRSRPAARRVQDETAFLRQTRSCCRSAQGARPYIGI